ncbi:CRISPR-associated protein Cas4 [Pseudoalteromonas ardens]|uniref:CRISPR-associated exonuclease Cas4 n=1 Tax=Pseudoalteromonas rubra TaxID=43658 RepID=A0A0L0ER55_9GAMM|nr:CRISPR-associated protein Cas4 [Pseudoalteromonas sp. R96]KNC66378.1 CRISPR-associated protein Cas4 [Pseudoalteromonas rubra]MDK1310324.1 CRISPR-associated protein Cas4 [Pseudoalteromonas sp. R96]
MHSDVADRRSVTISALQHYLFCPRQCALIHLEQVWQENFLTAHGRQLHERVDSGAPESRKGVRFERGVTVNAPKLGLHGQLDLLEYHTASSTYLPVEYKRGKPKATNVDKVQLCAQALCMEEMMATQVEVGALWYWQTRKRLEVEIDAALRAQTLALLEQIQNLFRQGRTPQPEYGKHCKACSLYELCQPKLMQGDRSSAYVLAMFNLDEK